MVDVWQLLPALLALTGCLLGFRVLVVVAHPYLSLLECLAGSAPVGFVVSAWLGMGVKTAMRCGGWLLCTLAAMAVTTILAACPAVYPTSELAACSFCVGGLLHTQPPHNLQHFPQSKRQQLRECSQAAPSLVWSMK